MDSILYIARRGLYICTGLLKIIILNTHIHARFHPSGKNVTSTSDQIDDVLNTAMEADSFMNAGLAIQA